MTDIKEHMEVIGADGVHVGTVDRVEGHRIKLTRKDSGEGSHKGHHHTRRRPRSAPRRGRCPRCTRPTRPAWFGWRC